MAERLRGRHALGGRNRGHTLDVHTSMLTIIGAQPGEHRGERGGGLARRAALDLALRRRASRASTELPKRFSFSFALSAQALPELRLQRNADAAANWINPYTYNVSSTACVCDDREAVVASIGQAKCVIQGTASRLRPRCLSAERPHPLQASNWSSSQTRARSCVARGCGCHRHRRTRARPEPRSLPTDRARAWLITSHD